MNRILSLLLLSMIAVTAVADELKEFNYSYQGQTYTYRIESESPARCILDGSFLADDIESVIIPEVAIDNDGTEYTVVGFTGLNERKNLKTVKLPSSITEVPYKAFNGCSGLTSIELPS